MNLDSRILECKKPLTCFDIDIAKQFIGKDGYFAHEMAVFENLDCCYFSRLLGFDTCDKSIPFAVANASRDYEFFMPAEWVKPEEPEKKYRPYTVMEFIKEYPLGSHLHFRPKDQTIEMHRLIDGYNDCLNGAGTVFMCGAMYSMSELYDNYDIFKDGEWKPFGIEVEEK